MHALRLVEIAASFARHADVQLAIRVACPKEAVHSYWLTARYRHDLWSSRLAAHRAAIQRPGSSQRAQQWLDIIPTIQEVLLSEPLTRCVAHHAACLEEQEIDFDFGPLAQSAFAAHLEARHRCLHLIVFGSGLSPEQAARLNHLRRACEAVTDQLLATLMGTHGEDTFSFDPLSTATARTKIAATPTQAVMRLHTSAALHWFVQETALDIDYRQENPVQNERMATATNGLWPDSLFDSFGVPLSKSMATIRADENRNTPFAFAANPLSSPLDLLKIPSRRAASQTNETANKRFD
ncbi:MAG: hypothetical protein AAGG44_18395 [Planctomycetota bacterium]